MDNNPTLAQQAAQLRVLVLDNYDSFTYNLVQYIQELLGRDVTVLRNDAITVEAVDEYDIIILSPGPGIPSQAGIMPALLQRYSTTKCILGVCLGHQAIGEAFGARLLNLEKVFHGIETDMQLTAIPSPLFRQLPATFRAGRYHSWVIEKGTLPPELLVTAIDDTGEIMALHHRDYAVFGVQFHPESIMTEHGMAILENFFTYCAARLEATV